MEKRKVAKQLIMIAVGIIISTFGIINFATATSLASGGVAGITIILYHLFGFSTGISNLVINIPLLIVFWRFSSKWTFFLTLYGIALMSVFLQFWETIGVVVPNLSNDMMVAGIAFGVTLGLGMGIVLRYDGTTGGGMIVAKILHDKWDVSYAKTFLIFDTIVIVASAFLFLGFTDAIYSLISLYIFSVVTQKLQEGTLIGYKVLIFTEKREELTSRIYERLHRGVTLVSATGAYSQNDKTFLMVIIDKGQLVELKRIIQEVDSESFVSVSHTYETLGEGFTFEAKGI